MTAGRLDTGGCDLYPEGITQRAGERGPSPDRPSTALRPPFDKLPSTSSLRQAQGGSSGLPFDRPSTALRQAQGGSCGRPTTDCGLKPSLPAPLPRRGKRLVSRLPTTDYRLNPTPPCGHSSGEVRGSSPEYPSTALRPPFDKLPSTSSGRQLRTTDYGLFELSDLFAPKLLPDDI
jgi:hypothetical protein